MNETMYWIRFYAAAAFLISGVVIFIIELLGVYKFKYILNRMHCAALGDTLGIGLCLIGLIILSGFNFTSLKFFLVLLFLWFSSPVASHLVSRLETNTNRKLSDYCEVKD